MKVSSTTASAEDEDTESVVDKSQNKILVSEFRINNINTIYYKCKSFVSASCLMAF